MTSAPRQAPHRSCRRICGRRWSRSCARLPEMRQKRTIVGMKAAIYARYSSDKQNERSVDDQVAHCRVIAERAGYDVVEVYSDRAVSGASILNRQGFLALMKAASERTF